MVHLVWLLFWWAPCCLSMSVQIYWIESGAQHLAPLILLPSGLSGSWFLAPCLSWLGRCWGGTVKGQAKFIPCAKFFSSLHNSLSLYHKSPCCHHPALLPGHGVPPWDLLPPSAESAELVYPLFPPLLFISRGTGVFWSWLAGDNTSFINNTPPTLYPVFQLNSPSPLFLSFLRPSPFLP